MRKKLSYTIIMVIFAGIFTLTGCGAKQERLSVAGSTSVQPIAETLAEDFMKNNRDIILNVQGGGSSAGIKAAQDGTAAIGTSSRELQPDEEKGLVVAEIAIDGIAIVMHPSNPVQNLTLDQLRKIFSGEITNWAQVGGSNAAIMLVNREEGSGTRGAFTEIVMKDRKLSPKAIVQGSTGAARQSVSQNQNAIGYISLAALNSSVKAVSIDQVPCTVENIKQKKYAIRRPFLFVYKKPEAEGVKQFIDYVLGDGQRVVAENGLIPVK